ncbi:MAG: PH domain-containing protein [Kineosporiaceae bacterium]
MTEDAERARRRAQLHAPIRPRVSLLVARGVAVATVGVLAVVAAVLPGGGSGGFRPLDRVGVVAVGVAVAAILWWFSRVLAVPGEDGLRVRNLVVDTVVPWEQITEVRFGGGSPWAVLDLGDGESLPVMAVQRSDGEAAVAAARRLATLVALHAGERG